MNEPGVQPADPTPEPAADSDDSPHELDDLLHFIRDTRGFDFTGYKRSSLTRRIRKRMHDVGISDYLDYRDLLEANTEEFRSLFNTILINVTSFFRDPEAWRYLRQEVVPAITARSGPGQEIRVWSAGCSSGEEAYSLAIVFAEAIGIEECAERVKIYGTDVDDQALHDARAGTYSAEALEPVSDELRGKYFEEKTDGFTFRNDLRRRVIFGRHDITRDAPISRLDLLVCRNTLMYFNVEAQSLIMDRFHFALRDEGFLFLGKAEMVLSAEDRFAVASMRHRIFRRRAGEPVTRRWSLGAPRLQASPAGEVSGVTLRRQLRDLVLDAMPNAAIAIDAQGEVVLINAAARARFGLTAHDVGRPFSELEISYRPVELRSLIEQAQTQRRTVRVGAVKRAISVDDFEYFDVLVQPLWGFGGRAVGVTIAFLDTTTQTHLNQDVKRTREDLETAYEELQSTNEELETANEELQSSIEELETTNEELQSTNEELETTNEELQSGNQELEAVNRELRVRSEQLAETRGFLEGVVSSVAAGVVVLDARLRVRSWNKGAEDLWGLRADEVHDQAFFDLAFGLHTESLRELVGQCAATGQSTGPADIDAVNRIGRAITCSVTCSPLTGHGGGVVLWMDERSR